MLLMILYFRNQETYVLTGTMILILTLLTSSLEIPPDGQSWGVMYWALPCNKFTPGTKELFSTHNDGS